MNVLFHFQVITNTYHVEDEDDVAEEKRRVKNGETAGDILVIKDLSKVVVYKFIGIWKRRKKKTWRKGAWGIEISR